LKFPHTFIQGRKKLFWPFAGATVLLDQITKLLLVHSPDEARPPVVLIPHVLQLINHPGNVRGIFGQGPQSLAFYIVASLVGLGIVAFFLATAPPHKGFLHAALGLLAGGAVGNLVDRAVFHAVRDFIDLHWGEAFHWYTFNVADAAICVGFGLVVYESVIRPDGRQKGSEAAGASQDEG